MRKGKKSLVLLLIFAMALSLFPQTAYAAKKKVKLNKKSVIVNVGKTVKIKLNIMAQLSRQKFDVFIMN